MLKYIALALLTLTACSGPRPWVVTCATTVGGFQKEMKQSYLIGPNLIVFQDDEGNEVGVSPANCILYRGAEAK